MDPRHLKKDELEYEMFIRRIGSDNTDCKRMDRLQELLLAEFEATVDEPRDLSRLTRANVAKDVRECDVKLKEILTDLDEADREADVTLKDHGQSRLVHIAGRIRRLKEFAPSTEDVTELYERVQEVGKQMAIDLVGNTAGGAVGYDDPAKRAKQQELAQLTTPPKTGAIRKSLPSYDRINTEAEKTSTKRLAPDPLFNQPFSGLANNNIWSHQFLETTQGVNVSNKSQSGGLSNEKTTYNQTVSGPRPQKEATGYGRSMLNDQRMMSHVQGRHEQMPSVDNYGQPPQDVHRSSYANQNERGLAGGHFIHKWVIRFDGGQNGLGAEDFIYRAEQQASLYGVTGKALAMGIGDLMAGRANQWFWTFRRQMPDANWSDFKLAFLRRYAPHKDSDYEIRSKNQNRKQRANESFNEFCQDIEALAVRLLRPMPNDELIEILRRNMLMDLRKALWRQEIYTVDELVRACCEYEELCRDEERLLARQRHMRVNEFVYQENPVLHSYPGPSTDHASLNTGGAIAPSSQFKVQPHNQDCEESTSQYVPYELSRVNYNHHHNTQVSYPLMLSQFNQPPPGHVEAINNEPRNNDYIVCWNCSEMGHVFAKCPKPQMKVFCFTCGMRDKLTVTCPWCNLNLKRDQTQAGTTRPSTSHSHQILQRPNQPNPSANPFTRQKPRN